MLPQAPPSVAAPVAVSLPVAQTSIQQEHKKKVDLAMKMYEKQDSKAEHKKQLKKEVEEG